MKSFKWGIIGPGNIAHDFARDIKLTAAPQEIVAVLSDRQQSADDFANEFGIEKRFTNLNDFIDNSQAEIVYVATPHPLHYKQVKACLEKNIAVLCEKPITINSTEFKELQQLSKENNVFLMEAMWICFLPGITTLLQLIEEDKIGDIISVKSSMSFKAPYNESSRFYDPAKGGGSLLDLGVYCVFLSTLLLGNPSEIKAIGKNSSTGIDEACSVLLRYGNASYAMLESSLLKKQNSPAEIYGTKGVLRLLNPWFEKSPGIEIEMDDGDKQTIPLHWEGHGMQYEIEEVINCVSAAKTESDNMPHTLSRNILKTMDEIRRQIHVSYPQEKHLKKKTTVE